MNKVFRTKRMKMTAWLLAASVCLGSMDVSMLTVRAQELYAQEDPEEADAMKDTGAPQLTEETPEADGAEAILQTERMADEAGEATQDSGEAEDIEYAAETAAAVSAAQQDTDTTTPQTTQADTPAAQADEEEEPTGPVTVAIQGVVVQNKVYDGSAGSVSGLKVYIPKEVSESKTDVDITSLVTLKYTITGTKKDNSSYSYPKETSDSNTISDGSIRNGMPKDAGEYTLTVRVEDSSNKYTGAQSCTFAITQRPITIRPKDVTKKIGDAVPTLDKPGDYMIIGTLASGETQESLFTATTADDPRKAPTLTCDVDAVEEGTGDSAVKIMKKSGVYTITASGANAGPNYFISYQEGTLTVSEKETVKITGITVADKVYDAQPVSWSSCGLQEGGTLGDQIRVTDTSTGQDITSQVELNLRISGQQNNGKSYSFVLKKKESVNAETGDPEEEEDEDDPSKEDPKEPEVPDGMPVNAGEYALTITVTAEKYKGIYKKEFTISRRPVTLKADDVEVKQGEKIPAFTYTTVGLLGKDEITTQPLYDCDITSTEKTGQCAITPRKASAGGNYAITYESGTLKVLEKDRIEISGVTIPAKVYDDTPSVCNKDNLKVVLNQVGTQSKDITDQVTCTYEISGTTEAGRAYSSTNIETGMPTEAGEYTLTVNAASEPDVTGSQYRGSQDWSFRISKRPLIVKVNDMEIRTEEELPLPGAYSYTLAGMGFVGDDAFTREPVFTCDIQNTDRIGTYDIVASDADAGSNYSIEYVKGTLTVIEKEVVKTRRLLRIIAPAPVKNVENGTSLDKLPLPETVTIVTRDFNAVIDAEDSTLSESNETAGVTWERKPIDGTSYSISNEGEQTFTIGGTVVLPAEVDGEEVSLAVQVQVSVREKWALRDKVAAPVASIPGSSPVLRGTTVALSCETEGAQIYYTLDHEKPDWKNSTLYTLPIEINGSTVIWAYAHKEGQPDSDIVKYYYYIGTPDGADEEPEVPKEDIPDDGIIPEGLWVTKIADYTYTGKAIKPEVRVYDYKTRLEEKKDYTVSYANNTKAADQNAEKAPSVIITGKGNYEGKLTKRFTILPKSIGDSDVTIDNITVAYNKKAQKPSPSVLWNGKKLAAKKDYLVQEASYTEPGGYDVTVTGTGNYTGTRTVKFTITEGILVSKLTIGKIPNQPYTGMAIEPQPTVKYKGAEIPTYKDRETIPSSVTDYVLLGYESNTKVGTATVTIDGRGAYAGRRRVTFKITELASLSKAKVELKFTNTPTYTGREIRADQEIVTLTVKGESTARTLTQGVDYDLTYTNNVKAGTATATFTGKGAYGGKTKKTFKIVACDIEKATVRLDKSYSYEKGGCKPQPVVTYGSKTLAAGTDYTLVYKYNNAVGQAELTIKGKSNWKGSVSRTYEITPQDLGKLTVEAADKVYQNKKNIYKTTVQVTDVNGKRLAAGKDYSKNIEYTYAETTRIGKDYKAEGTPIDKADILPVGTKINVTVTATGANYTGTATGTYRIVQANISGAKVTIPVQTYTGGAVTPDVQSIRVELKGSVLKPGEDYEVVSYSNNINKGTAKVVLRGLGEKYGGTKTASFKIKGKGLF